VLDKEVAAQEALVKVKTAQAVALVEERFEDAEATSGEENSLRKAVVAARMPRHSHQRRAGRSAPTFRARFDMPVLALARLCGRGAGAAATRRAADIRLGNSARRAGKERMVLAANLTLTRTLGNSVRRAGKERMVLAARRAQAWAAEEAHRHVGYQFSFDAMEGALLVRRRAPHSLPELREGGGLEGAAAPPPLARLD